MGLRDKATRWALALVVVVHLLALYLPGSPDVGPVGVPHLDKLVHVLLFAAPTYLVRRLTPARWPVVLIALHAPVSELLQYRLIPNRSGDPLDLLADAAGIGLGVCVAAMVRHRKMTT